MTWHFDPIQALVGIALALMLLGVLPLTLTSLAAVFFVHLIEFKITGTFENKSDDWLPPRAS
jgi:hypothetical protein